MYHAIVIRTVPHIQTVLKAAGPLCDNASCVESVSVESSLIEELLTCFLVNSSCSLFSGITNQPYSNTLVCECTLYMKLIAHSFVYWLLRCAVFIVAGAPLNRYVSVVSGGDDPILSKGYTSVIFQLVAKYTAFNDTILSCLDCWSMVNSTDQVRIAVWRVILIFVVFVVEHWTNEVTLPTFTCSASSNHEYINLQTD